MCELPPEWRKEIPEEPIDWEGAEQLVHDVWQVNEEALGRQLVKCLCSDCRTCLFLQNDDSIG